MSQISKIKISVRSPNASIARKALQTLAQEMNTAIIDFVRDYEGRTQQVLGALAIEGRGKQMGFGVKIENGQLVIVGDYWERSTQFQQFKQRFLQHYMAHAVAEAATAIGFRVTETHKDKETILLTLEGLL